MASYLRMQPRDRASRGTSNKDFPHDMRKLSKLCKAQGWTIEILESHRARFRNPQGESVVVTASKEPRSIMNAIASLRRLGLQPPDYVRMREPSAPTLTVPLMEFGAAQVLTASVVGDIDMQPSQGNGNGTHAVEPSSPRPDRKRVILRAIERQDLGTGVHPKGITEQVQVHYPKLDTAAIQRTMSNYKVEGLLTARGDGRYSLSDAGRALLANQENYKPPAKPRFVKPKPFALTAVPTPDSIDDDVRTLDAALTALADVERIIKKHRDAALSIAKLRAVLGVADVLGVKHE